MRIAIDNNVILDVLLERKPFFKEAQQVMIACADDNRGYLTANSLTDIFYVLRKFIGTTQAKSAIRQLVDLFMIISVDDSDCLNALSLPIDDFEDALMVVCAKKTGVDYIVTRDDKLLSDKSPVKTISPKGLIDLFGN